MKKELLLLWCLLYGINGLAQESTSTYSIAGAKFQVKHTCYNNSDVLFIHLHEDETTAITVLKDSLEKIQRYCLVNIEQNGKRNITGIYRGKSFRVDPNRIFTSKGAQRSYRKLNKTFQPQVVNSAISAGNALLKKFVTKYSLIIAVHNNKEKGFSVDYYLPGKSSAKDAREVFKNADMDPDNFILTTDTKMFQYFKLRNINAVLQHNQRAMDDGSLSIYCGKNNIRYLNLEIQIGDIESQQKLLSVVFAMLDEEGPH